MALILMRNLHKVKINWLLTICMLAGLSCATPTTTNDHDKISGQNESDQTCTYFLKNDTTDICLQVEKGQSENELNFKLKLSTNRGNYQNEGVANLILLEDNNGLYYVPEGTFIIDENTREEYICDSTYSFNSGDLSFSLGFERETKNRVSFTSYRSKIKYLENGNFTLYKK